MAASFPSATTVDFIYLIPNMYFEIQKRTEISISSVITLGGTDTRTY